ncbi:MAG: DUF2490 domain-containing protein [Ginsengibacter sp.]
MKYHLLPRTVFSLMVICMSAGLSAQNNKTGSLDIINLTYHLNSRFALFTEAETRSQLITRDFFYHEIKAGAFYYFPNTSSLFAGFGNYETYTSPGAFKRPVIANEYRLWEQLTIGTNIGKLKIEHRYRIEQRWINGKYSNRFRYRISPLMPLNHKTILPKTIYLTVNDEVFFTDQQPYFIRNRVYAGGGYQFSKVFTLQSGFIHQFDYRITDGGSGTNYIQTSLIFNLNYTNTKRPLHLVTE